MARALAFCAVVKTIDPSRCLFLAPLFALASVLSVLAIIPSCLLTSITVRSDDMELKHGMILFPRSR